MDTLILQTENKMATKEILKFIKSMKSVKFVSVENTKTRLTDEDWALPGRPFSDTELEEIAELMDKESEFKKSEDVFEDLLKSIKK